ncbi:MAG: cysteine--tRNA ligase [bacterium]|nr:cysteine--tRNA ligase [bacterium]
MRIHNTLTNKKEEFVPVINGQVSFYVCGVTVYDYCHIGHARAYVVFDYIRRYLEYQGYKVRYTQNFTDIDDKIIARANERGVSIQELTREYISAYFEDMDKLYIKRADSYPKATEYINEMQDIIKSLIKNNYAYIIDEEVFFSVEKSSDYGKLSKKVLDDLVAGSRVEVSDKKRNPFDFILWKKAKAGEPGWDSPWGNGRPGWHIECSAMVNKELGDTIDIHAGGEDLVFPHHENEIAQSESYTGKPFANYWIHNGFVNIRNEKMAKSKKNFFTIRKVLEKYNGETIRFFLMRVHYRTPLNFSFEGIDESAQALERLYNTIKLHKNVKQNSDNTSEELKVFNDKFVKAMDDDFNSAEATGVLFELNKYINKTGYGVDLLLKLGKILGLFNIEQDSDAVLTEEIQSLLDERMIAKKERNYEKADLIRERLFNEHSIIIEDTIEGVRWKRK